MGARLAACRHSRVAAAADPGRLAGSGATPDSSTPLLFPPPSKLITAAGRMLSTGELTGHLRRHSHTNGAWTHAIGSRGGELFCGLAMGASASVRRSLEFLISGLYSTPKLALLPVVMLLVGVGEKAGIILIAATSFGMMAIHCLDGVRNLNQARTSIWRSIMGRAAGAEFSGRSICRAACRRSLPASVWRRGERW